MSDPWDEIPPSNHPSFDNVRRVEVQYPLDFRRGRDFRGRYIFVLEGKAAQEDLPGAPKIGGIDVLAIFEGGNCKLVLTLLDSALLELFHVLCHDLLTATSRLPRGDNSTGLLVVLNRLISWQVLLRQRGNEALTKQQIIGLMGELLFLRDVILPKAGPGSVAAWRGSFRDEQDFVHGDSIIEVKTQLSTADQRMHISSEAQLDTSSGRILICHQTLGASSASDARARTLNELVDEIRLAIRTKQPAAVMDFEVGLTKAEYSRRPEYDADRWTISTRRIYRVSDEFPRIVPSMLRDGIERVRYQVRLEACKPFELKMDEAMELVFG